MTALAVKKRWSLKTGCTVPIVIVLQNEMQMIILTLDTDGDIGIETAVTGLGDI